MPANQPQLENKNLIILEDQLNSEAIAVKKCAHYASMFTDPALKTFATDMAQKHRQRFDSLYQYLNSHQ